jgi:hypothetical protein
MSSLDTTPEETEFAHGFQQLAEVVETCKQNAKRHGERFNIFSILGV